ncbi:MAG TPA: efflux RND transporter periplasmic adaptor subunit [Crocinitomicaceae bacterium]|nr:efflux RND transporter periplasmic adaptor subunit [Crocinitomicaceae bacterium]
MKKIINILILLALVAIVVVQLLSNKKTSENRVYHYDKQKAIIVNTQTIAIADINSKHEFTGTFDANKDAKINADFGGKITRFYVDEGSKVRKGQTLIKLDDVLLKLQLKATNVQISGLEADEKRYIILTEADAIQGMKLEKTQMTLEGARIQRSTLLEKIKKTTIRAPFNGIVTMKMSEVGSFAAPGMPLLMLTDITALKFKINVSENNLDLFEMNEAYPIQIDAYPNVKIEGVVTSIGSKGNMGNSFPVIFEMKNTPDSKIKSKMFGKVLLDGSKVKQGISIPAATIVGSDMQPKVYVIKNGKAVLQPVKVSRRIGNRVIIADGIKEGDQIVTTGFINLFDGANVKVK